MTIPTSTSAAPASPQTESDPAMTPQEYLAAADAAMASEQPLEASRLLWLAGEATFIRLAEAHGMPGDDLHALARALDAKEGRTVHYQAKLGIAIGLRHNAELDFMEPYELEYDHESMTYFVREYA